VEAQDCCRVDPDRLGHRASSRIAGA
jgi:hypothetical protein